MTAQYGDLILSGNIDNANSCHSIAISGKFSRQVGSNSGPDLIALALYIDGIEVQSGQIEATFEVPDPTIKTIIGDHGNPGQPGTLMAPIILNTALEALYSPWTVGSFSEAVCSGT